jgi:hypothetical protein
MKVEYFIATTSQAFFTRLKQLLHKDTLQLKTGVILVLSICRLAFALSQSSVNFFVI